MDANQVLGTPVGALAELDSDSLFQLKRDAADLLAVAKAMIEHVDRALDLRYGQVHITADLPKTGKPKVR